METVRGVAILQVDKDLGVTELILSHVGLNPVTLTSDYYEYLDIVENEFSAYLRDDDLTKIDKALEATVPSSKPSILLARLYVRDYMVRKILLVSLRRGLISKMTRRLASNGWKTLMLFEAYRIPSKMRHLR
ncbi:hypothetical protein GCM10007981_05450 [Thermocladium modestius]|uniref:Uncharacterized protein n=1 Tax=Thermocladium modestius TaxID=62609 RepID=A0A830GV86_9CREN|nr:hypothetical protein [Thermocladium modestius]GGP19900.1 hypothetical protein GCM10007981_05450 [Thermocladium modestius]